MVRGAETVEQVITAALLADATAVHAPAQGDKAVLQQLNDLKRMFGRLIVTTAPDKATVNVNNLTAAQWTTRGQQLTVAAATQAAKCPPSASTQANRRRLHSLCVEVHYRVLVQWNPVVRNRFRKPPHHACSISCL